MNPETSTQQPASTMAKTKIISQVTPFSKYAAMVLFVLLPFIGGWIGYQYAPTKVVQIEIPIDTMGAAAQENESHEVSVDFALSTYDTEEREWVKLYRNESLAYSFIIGEEVGGTYCYLGLCDAPSLGDVVTRNGTLWQRIDTSNCIGGCNAIQSFYRSMSDNKYYHFIIWEDGSLEQGLSLLELYEI